MPKGKKYAGRTAGTPNKKTADVINRAEKILQLIETEYFEDDIKELTSAQRMMLYSDMLEYVAPKLSRQEIRGTLNNKITLEIVRTNSQILPANPPSISENGNGHSETL